MTVELEAGAYRLIARDAQRTPWRCPLLPLPRAGHFYRGWQAESQK